MSKNISKLSGRKGLSQNLFEQIKKADVNPHELSSQYHIGKSTLAASQTFYEFLDEAHTSRLAWVCTGTSCLCSGDPQEVKVHLESILGDNTVGSMTCLGHCYDADSFHYRGKSYSGGEKIDPEISSDTNGRILKSRQIGKTSILTDQRFSSTKEFAASTEALIKQPTLDTLETIKASGLRGRGGAGFPTGIKWESCMRAISETKYVVCNADEGDPGAFSDRYLLEQQPLRVIFGMMAAARITGAGEGVVYIRAEYPESVAIMQKTINDLMDENLLGPNILGSDFSFSVLVIEGAGAYICGEETALIASIEGRRPEVDVRPPFPTVEGLYKKPTVLNNVETFAAIAGILDIGAEVYSKLGTARSTGTKLVSLDAGFGSPGVVEIEMGMPLRQFIDEVADGFKQPIKAIHIGGPLGGLVPLNCIDDLCLDYESFDQAGFLLGHAGMVCIPETFPMIRYLEHLFQFTADESCGKCFPCRLGSIRGKEMFTAAINGEKLLNRSLLDDLLVTMRDGSLCALGGGLPLPVENTLKYFADELAAYFEEDRAIPVKALT
jgi:NADH:ubiquinone oxidoreductase subunit F (NADH-binding)